MKRIAKLLDPAEAPVIWAAVLVCVALLVLGGCSHYGEYAEAWKAKAIADAAVNEKRAEAEGKKWEALKEFKGTEGGAVAVGIAAALDAQGSKFEAALAARSGQAETLQAPRDWFDRLLSGLDAAARLGSIGVALVDTRERNKTARAGYAADVDKERIRADGSAKLVEATGKVAGTKISAGGDVAVGGSVDKRDCKSTGGTGGNGAQGGAGAAGGTGSATTGSGGSGGAAAPGAAGGSGAAGGAAGGNCGP